MAYNTRSKRTPGLQVRGEHEIPARVSVLQLREEGLLNLCPRESNIRPIGAPTFRSEGQKVPLVLCMNAPNAGYLSSTIHVVGSVT
jgi:hypothetical protein